MLFDPADVEVFNRMHLEVVRRQNFVPFSLEYFKKEFAAFAQDNQIALFFATYQGKVIAAAISGALAALVGPVYANYVLFIDPESVLGVPLSIDKP